MLATETPVRPVPRAPRKPGALRLGFVPLVHAAPLFVARHLGLFRRHGLEVRLSQEVGWATIREKILGGELDAAQALAPLPLAMTLGLGSPRAECLTALVLAVHGDTIVLSRRLWQVSQGEPHRLATPRHSGRDPLTFGIVYPHSAQAFLLRRWAEQAGLVPDSDYRLVVVPPQQMVAHLKAGHIDGACVGEPWGSLAVHSGCGIVTALSADLAPGHPEKVLLVRRGFHEHRAEEHLALVAALREACLWCANPAHHDDLIRLLSARDALASPPACIRPGITGAFDLGAGRSATRPDALLFSGAGVNEPSPRHAAWIAHHLGPAVPRDILNAVYRSDLYHAALARGTSSPFPTDLADRSKPHETNLPSTSPV